MEPTPTTPLKDYNRASFLAVVVWSCVLCFNGGFVNGVSVAGVFHLGLTHMTGLTTKSGSVLLIWPQPGQMPVYGYFAFIVSFLLGAFFVGVTIGSPKLKWGLIQGICVLVESFALFLGWHFSPRVLGGAFLAFSMGIQNGVTSNFTAGALRTSHVSGTVLDIGLGLGQCLRLRNLDNMWKVKLHVPNYIFFWAGGVAGTAVYNSHDKNAYLASAFFALIIGLWTVCTQLLDQYFEKRDKMVISIEEPKVSLFDDTRGAPSDEDANRQGDYSLSDSDTQATHSRQ